jgi:hypothetical protein
MAWFRPEVFGNINNHVRKRKENSRVEMLGHPRSSRFFTCRPSDFLGLPKPLMPNMIVKHGLHFMHCLDRDRDLVSSL